MATIAERASQLVGLKGQKSRDFSSLATRGLRKSSLDHFMRKSKLSPTVFYRYLDITPRALSNYGPSKALRLYLADRVLDLAKLYAHGQQVFGSIDNFNYWLNNPAIDLRGGKPVDLVYSRHGLERIDDILGRIEHGIPV